MPLSAGHEEKTVLNYRLIDRITPLSTEEFKTRTEL